MPSQTYNILHTTSNDVKSVVVIGNKMYIATPNEVNVVDLVNKVVIDSYTTTVAGKSGDTLNSTNIVDIDIDIGV